MRRLILVLSIAMITFIGFVFYTTPETPVVSNKVEVVPVPPEIPSQYEAMLNAYEDYINESLALSGTPGAAVAIIIDSVVVYTKGFGIKSVGTQDPVDVHTVFRLGSVSKPVTASLAGLLATDSLLRWDDPTTKYLPDFTIGSPEHTQPLTIRHVLSQSTGLPYHTYTTLIEDGVPLPAMLEAVKQIDPIGKPGQFYTYQNVAYSLIEPVINVATGCSFEEIMQERLFDPLFMSDASVSYESIMKNCNVAEPHLFRGRQWKQIPISDTYYNAAPAGGINASISDMANWMKAMLGQRPDIISQPAIDQLFEPHVKATAKNRNFSRWSRIKRAYYGLGWRIINFQNDTLAYHGGYVNGYRSEVAIHSARQIAICVLANGPSSFSDHAIPTFFSIYDTYMLPAESEVLAAP